MRVSLSLLKTAAIPLSSIPPSLLRLPVTSNASTLIPLPSKTSSPTISKLLKTFSARKAIGGSVATLGANGRGLGRGNFIPSAETMEEIELNSLPIQTSVETESEMEMEDGRGLGSRRLPNNLRIEEFIDKRKEYEGVKAGHRDLLRRLRREG